MRGLELVIPAAVLLIGLFAGIFAAQFYDLRFGGVVVVPLLAVYILFDLRAFPLFVISTATAYVTLAVIERRLVLYGRRLFITAIVAGALVPITTALVTRFALDDPVVLRDVAFLGSILPGIAAYNLHRLDREDQVADVVGSLTLLVALVLLAAFFLLLDSVVGSATPTVDAVVRTATMLVLGQRQPSLAPPEAVLPREFIVALFVLGLVINEGIRRRYGLRLAGIIAIPLVAVFAVYSLRLLALYLVVTAVAAVYIRLLHRSTLLYGRNLLGGACVVGVLLGMVLTPLLPPAVGLRPLIVGILGGVTAYNGHALAPGERVQSVVLSVGTFVALFALTNAVAHLLGKAIAYQIGPTMGLLGIAILATAALVVFEFERLRPTDDIETVSFDEETAIPDGGDPEGERVVSDGGTGNPLAGRQETRLAANATVVTRDGGHARDA